LLASANVLSKVVDSSIFECGIFGFNLVSAAFSGVCITQSAYSAYFSLLEGPGGTGPFHFQHTKLSAVFHVLFSLDGLGHKNSSSLFKSVILGGKTDLKMTGSRKQNFKTLLH